MLTTLVIFALFTSSLAIPVETDATATATKNEFSDDGAGNFNFAFETSNGIKENVEGKLKKIPSSEGDGEVDVVVQQGSFLYPGPDGKPIKVEWIADENGFKPKGSHIPPAASVVPFDGEGSSVGAVKATAKSSNVAVKAVAKTIAKKS